MYEWQASSPADVHRNVLNWLVLNEQPSKSIQTQIGAGPQLSTRRKFSDRGIVSAADDLASFLTSLTGMKDAQDVTYLAQESGAMIDEGRASVTRDFPRAPLIIASVFAAYIAASEIILLLPALLAGRSIGVLPPAETISLLGGGVTAAGLYALFVQLRSAEAASHRAREQDSQVRAERRMQAALRLDSLHEYFNSREMRDGRELAWRYLDFVRGDQARLSAFARKWVLSQGEPDVPAFSTPIRLQTHAVPEFTDYSWALSLVVAFFVRLEAHISLHDDAAGYTPEQLQEAVGPFFWHYWREGLLEIADECGRLVGGLKGKIVYPAYYFVGPLQRLDRKLVHTTGTTA